jgi:predicted PurR-regulated permease PerM
MPDVTARIDVPTRTIVKVVLVLAVLWFLRQIGPVLLQLFGGLLLAMTLYPPVVRLRARGYSKGRAIVTVFGVFVVGLAIVLAVLVPRLIDDGRTFWEDLPEYVADGGGWIKENAPWIYDRLESWAQSQAGATDLGATDDDLPTATDGGQSTGTIDLTSEDEIAAETDGGFFDARSAISAGQGLAGVLGNTFVAIVLAIYFLVEGERAFRWLARDLPPRMVTRIRRAAPALAVVVSEYVSTQLRTCLICGIYTYIVLVLLDVPSPFILATIAAVTDAVPLVGVVMATVPAVIVALTQGWEVALVVLLAYVAYQVFENYVLIPRILGRRLHLSSFGMLMAVLIGWKLAGLPGVLLALPAAAALLVIERVWQDEDPGVPVPEVDQPGLGDVVESAVEVATELSGESAPDPTDADPERTDRERPPRPAARPLGSDA